MDGLFCAETTCCATLPGFSLCRGCHIAKSPPDHLAATGHNLCRSRRVDLRTRRARLVLGKVSWKLRFLCWVVAITLTELSLITSRVARHKTAIGGFSLASFWDGLHLSLFSL